MEEKRVSRKWLIAIPIIAVLLALCVLMAAVLVISTRNIRQWDIWNHISLGGIGAANVSAEADEQKSFTVDTPATLVIDNTCGKIDVRAVDGSEIRLTAHKQAWGKDQAEAQAELAKFQVSATQEGNTVHISLQNPDQVCHGARLRPNNVDFLVETPVQTAVQAASELGDVSLQGSQGDAKLKSSFGNVSAQDVQGAIAIETANGRVQAQSIQAGDGKVDLKSSFGSIDVVEATADTLQVITTNGAIHVQGAAISGAVTLSSDFGSVNWADGSGQTLDAKSKNGGVTLSNLQIDAAAQAASDFGSIHLDGVQADSYSATTKNGRIEIGGATGAVTAHSDFGDIAVSGDGPRTINLTSQNGAISYQGALADGESIVKTSFGNVTLRLPQDAAFDFDLSTNFGKISSAFPIQINGAPNEKHWQGQVAGGGPKLTVSTQNGNISLEYQS